MLTAQFDYHLPADRIAQQALPRGASRLFVVDRHDALRHAGVRDLPDLLRPGDLLVRNDTRVLPARLHARRPGTGGRVELLLVERQGEREWTALLQPARRARPGSELLLDDELSVRVLAREGDGRNRILFSEPIEPHLGRLGNVPLPPYIRRLATPEDRDRYQTVYAAVDGAIAAPTAGLHFDPALFEALAARGIVVTELTLHVGIGTFKPVTAELVHEHRMDGERFTIPAATAELLRTTRRSGGRIAALGTTVARALEHVAAQHDGEVPAAAGVATLFITPGFAFRVVDLLLTNFHLPRSTLLMLVCAFAGRERVLAAYAEAIGEGYRFYSYGDAMLVERRDR